MQSIRRLLPNHFLGFAEQFNKPCINVSKFICTRQLLIKCLIKSLISNKSVKYSAEKQNLRDMNSKLMDRLKHIWSSYKELNIKLQKLNSFESSSASPMPSDRETDREEHNSTQNLAFTQEQQQKPLSTTSRPHLAQPTTTTHNRLQMTTLAIARPIPTPTTPYWEELQPAIQIPQQHYPPQQQVPMITTTSPNTNQQPLRHTTTTNQQQSMTTMTKISKTTLEKERKNNSNTSRETQMLEIEIQTQTMAQQQEITRPRKKYQLPPMSQIIQQPITVAMRDTINSNMMPQPMIHPTIRRNMQESPRNTMLADRAMIPQATTTMPQTMMPQHINTTQVVEVNSYSPPQISQQAQDQQQPKHLQRLYLQQQLAYHQQEKLDQPKAESNRKRAVALWGHQVQLEESPAQNPICHNSLPRQQPKNSCDPELDLSANLSNDFTDPFDLEFSISSPSLMRSYDSDTCTEVDDIETLNNDHQSTDSLTDKTLSPAQTVIRKSTPVSQEMKGIVFGT